MTSESLPAATRHDTTLRILYYNWVDYLDDEKRGGGVSVYQRNVIDTLSAEPGLAITFLSSGISYDLGRKRPRWERLRHGPACGPVARYEIVNSGVVSPAHHSFGSPSQISHPETEAVFLDFLEKTGPYDVVHFNNIEGLPVSVLSLKARFPDTKIVLTLHNYYAICPQVNLWHQERELCRDFGLGRKCETCLVEKHDERSVKLAHSVAFTLKKNGVRPGTRLFDRAFLPSLRLTRGLIRILRRLRERPSPPGPQAIAPPKAATVHLQPLHLGSPRFQNRRAAFVAAINQNCDLVLGVSQRVCKVAQDYGIRPDLLRTSYIGIRQSDVFDRTPPRPAMLRPQGHLTLGYLGYMRRDKGFFFLLDALEQLSPDLAGRINLQICARRTDDQAMQRLAALCDRFPQVNYADGYTHEDLDGLLAHVDVGVIPVLWEDNLPQVAIEMHARRIPLLTSDLGGARELSNCDAMVFQAGNAASFEARLRAILDGEVTVADYWARAMPPVSNAAHADELLARYQEIGCKVAGRAGDFRPLPAPRAENA